jgi:predicted lysophospholipase L1 biosynthesis ABC-type transport system permease subunit
MNMHLPHAPYRRTITSACVLALCALALMVWSLFDQTVWPVMIAMSLGQVFGTLSLAAFFLVVVLDFRRMRKLARRAAAAGLAVPSSRNPGDRAGDTPPSSGAG